MKTKILLTGSSGFIGSNLLSILKKDYDVFCLVRKNRKKNDICCDLNNRKILKKKLKKINFKIIIDCAWLGVKGNQRNLILQNKNLLYTKNLISSLNLSKIKTFISFGSQAEYGICNNVITEESKTKPMTLYGKNKIKKFNYLKNILIKNKIRFLWLRIFSGYGPNESRSWVIPYLINNIIKKKHPILTTGEQNWNFLHVYDICNAITILLKHKYAKGIFNIAHPRTIKIKSLAHKIIKILKSDIKIKFGGKKMRNDQVINLNADVAKLIRYGWEPKISINKGIKMMISFYKS